MNTKKIVLTALFTALTAVATMFIRIPLFIGYVNLGDVFVLLAVFVLGPILGTMAGAIHSVGQATHHNDIGHSLGKPLHKFVTHTLTV